MESLNEILVGIQKGNFNNDELDTIVNAVKFARAQKARQVAKKLKVGDQVQYNGRNGWTQGVLEQIKIKKAIVRVGHTRWNVPLSMLEEV
jgi:ribosomal 50S subunit-recycling heat shock protein